MVGPDKTYLDVPFTVSYVHRIRFTDDVWGKDHAVLADLLEPSGNQRPRVQFWLDEDVSQANDKLVSQIRTFSDCHAERLLRIGNVQLVPGGEKIKNDIHILERMLKVFHVSDLDRRCYVIVIGGGAVLDAVGFAAAIAHRGIRLIRLPTTTLAQADSGIGVKNAVNLFGKKNWIGSFAPPWAVINDTQLLKSLSSRDFISGFSEAIKVALLKDSAMFDSICVQANRIGKRDLSVAIPMIRTSAHRHLEHITRGGDPFEALEARPLDFGHWSAHKLETMTSYAVRHGEAVAIGVAIDVVYSSLCHGFPEKQVQRVLRCLSQLGFSLKCDAIDDKHTLFAGLEEFRQHLGGRLTLTMLKDVAKPIDVHQVDRTVMAEAILRVQEFASTAAS